MQVVPLVPDELTVHVVGLAFLQSVNAIHLNLLLGRQRIAVHNALLLVQAAITLIVFLVLLRQGEKEVMDYVFAAYAAHLATALLSAIALFGRGGTIARNGAGSPWPVLFRQGALVQGANLMQLLNYRFTYWLLDSVTLGVFSVAVQLAEGAWLAPKSLGTVLYARVSNTDDVHRQRDLTLTILKASLAFSVAVTAVLLVVPDGVIRWAFGPEIGGLTPVIAILAPGIIAMSASQAFSHFFSGTGRNQHNVIGSALGLVLTVVLGFVLIPKYGLLGAAGTATAAYVANGLYQATVFARITATHWVQWLPRAADVDRFRKLWREARAR
jgi:O-antigen/teichoic acid export membrane protein